MFFVLYKAYLSLSYLTSFMYIYLSLFVPVRDSLIEVCALSLKCRPASLQLMQDIAAF